MVVVVCEAIQLFRVDAARIFLSFAFLFLQFATILFLASQATFETSQFQLFAAHHSNLALLKLLFFAT
jgi:hypothetical protein